MSSLPASGMVCHLQALLQNRRFAPYRCWSVPSIGCSDHSEVTACSFFITEQSHYVLIFAPESELLRSSPSRYAGRRVADQHVEDSFATDIGAQEDHCFARLDCSSMARRNHYAQEAHTIYLVGRGAVFSGESLSLALASSIPLEADEDGGVRAPFTLRAGQSVYSLA